MERNEQEMISFKTELALENCLQKTVIDRLHNEKIKKITERKEKGEIWYKSLPKDEKFLYMESTWEQKIKDESLRIIPATREFYKVAKNPAFVEYIDNLQALVCRLVKIILKQKTFAETLLKDNYKVALLEESENGTLEINGKKYIIHE